MLVVNSELKWLERYALVCFFFFFAYSFIFFVDKMRHAPVHFAVYKTINEYIVTYARNVQSRRTRREKYRAYINNA